jgi:HK97 family phage major capsid protein
MNLQEMKLEVRALHEETSAIKSRAESEGRDLRADESAAFNVKAGRMLSLENEIAVAENHPSRSLIRNLRSMGGNFGALLAGGVPPISAGRGQRSMSEEYSAAFLAFVRSGGKQATSALSEGFDSLFGGFALPALPGMSAASYEGTGGSSDGAGGYAVNVPTDGLIVPLAVPDIGVRAVSKAIPTSSDIKIPIQATFATAGIKAESGSSSNQFSESDPTLGQFTLSAWMTGLATTVSWELLQDVGMFQEFGIRGLIDAVDIAEDGFFVNGTGTSQPQGLIGNVGTGTAAPYAVESTGAYLLDSTMDVVGTLKGQYFANAGWLMSRATATAIRRAQLQANLFAAVWTREGGRDYLHGFPVTYSQAMPSIPTATTAGVTPILFGSFQDGYIIGDRGGAGTFVKILDQPLATSGQTILLGYKRVDGRVRRSEAIQQISISHS